MRDIKSLLNLFLNIIIKNKEIDKYIILFFKWRYLKKGKTISTDYNSPRRFHN